jgi:hypothetical protein
MYWAIGIALVLLFCLLYAKSKVNIKVEPLENPMNKKNNAEEAEELLKKRVSDLRDSLNMGTYKDSYSDILLALDEWAGLNMMDIIKSPKMNDPLDKSIEQVRMFNDICDFKRNLNLAMTFVDKS